MGNSNHQKISFDHQEIEKALKYLYDPGEVVELRCITKSHTEKQLIRAGYYENATALITGVGEVAASAVGIYTVLNPVNSSLLARSQNRLTTGCATTSDRDILRRRWLLIDVDPRRPSGISSSDEEHQYALETAHRIQGDLCAAGWPLPIYADSGNGAHLLYRIDLPTNDNQLVKRVLDALAFRYDDDMIEVDRSVFNPSRISKLYGTIARKGDHTPSQPHRLSRILDAPDVVEIVSSDLLGACADALPKLEDETHINPGAQKNTMRGKTKEFDLESWLANSGLQLRGPIEWQGGRKWIITECPWNPNHTNGSAYIVQFENGAIAAGCHHAHCQDNDWHALRALVEPGLRDVKNRRKQESDTNAEKKPTQAQELVEMALANSIPFHTPAQIPYVEASVNGHYEAMRVHSSRFRSWLSHMYWVQKNMAPGGQALQDVVNTISAQACYAGEERLVFLRVAHVGEKVYLDLTDDAWRVVEIDASGWRVADRSPIMFERSPYAKALPEPVHGGSVDLLWKFIPVQDPMIRLLVIAWLLSSFMPAGTYPIMVLVGEQGSAKSSVARILRKLVDPVSSLLITQPKNIRDLMVASKNHWILALDNLSNPPDWLSDLLCTLATGTGLSTRKLWTDDEEVLLEAKRPILINSIDDIVNRGDLLDRSIVLALPKIPQNQRKTECELFQEFDQVWGEIHGGLLDLVRICVARSGEVQLERLPRLADFVLWVSAVESSLGFPDGTFLSVFEGNQAESNYISVANSVVGASVMRLVASLSGQQKENKIVWRGTCSGLLEELIRIDVSILGAIRTPTQLSSQLRRLAPGLRDIGIEISFDKLPDRMKTRIVQITYHSLRTSDEPDASDAQNSIYSNVNVQV